MTPAPPHPPVPRLFSRAAVGVVVAALALALGACKSDPVGVEGGSDLEAALVQAEDLRTFHGALQSVGLTATLRLDGPYTVFAATDVAFLRLGEATTDELLEPHNRPLLERVVRHHIVPGVFRQADLQDGMTLETLDGTPLAVSREGEVVRVGGAELVGADEEASNGVLHRVDVVFREHLVTADRLALTPLAEPFVGFLRLSGALPLLAGADVYTVFVPTSDAFDAFGDPAYALLSTNAPVSRRVADFHLVPGRVDFGALGSEATLTARDGTALRLTRDADGVTYVDGRRVLAPPVPTANGLIVLLDGLLLDGLRLDERLLIAPDLRTFSALSRAAGLTPLLGGPDPLTVFAPTERGFQSMNADVLAALQQPVNAALLNQLLRVHVVPGRVRVEELVVGSTLQTIDGESLVVRRLEGDVTIGGRAVSEPAREALNGVLYELSGVLEPANVDLVDAAVLRGFLAYVDALRLAGLDAQFREPGPFTAFAPLDTAFAARPGLLSRPDLRDVLLDLHTTEPIPTLVDGVTFTSLSGRPHSIGLDGGGRFAIDSLSAFGPALVFGPTVATNGWLYGLDVSPP